MIDHSTSLSLSSTSSSLSASFTTSPSTANGGIIISVFPILCGVLIITTLALMNVAVICLRSKERSRFIHHKKAINKLLEDNQQLINDRDEANQKQEDIVLRQNCAYEQHDHSASKQQIRASAELNHHQDDTIVLQRNSAYEHHDHGASKQIAESNQRQDDAIVLQQNRAYELHDLRATHQQECASDDEPYLVILETAGEEEPHKKCKTANKQSEDVGGGQSASIELQCHHVDSAKSYDDEDDYI